MSENAAQPPSARRIPARRLIIAVAILALLLVWFSPYWAVAGLAQAAQANDVQRVSQYVDLPRLNNGLKGQLAIATQTEMSKHKSKALQLAGAALGVLAADRVVDRVLTPETITTFLAMKLQDVHGSRLSYALALANDGRAGWLTDSTFQVRLGSDSAMYWTRFGLRWRLDSVRVR